MKNSAMLKRRVRGLSGILLVVMKFITILSITGMLLVTVGFIFSVMWALYVEPIWRIGITPIQGTGVIIFALILTYSIEAIKYFLRNVLEHF